MAEMTLGDVYKSVWDILKEGASNRHSEARTMALCYRTREDFDTSHVVIRGADQEMYKVWFHTDQRTQKGADISTGDILRSVIYCSQKKIQLRLYGHAHVYHCEERTRSIWQNMSQFAKKCYLQSICPGKPVNEPNDLSLDEDEVGYSRFKIIEIQLDKISYLYLSHKGHIRSEFKKIENTDQWAQNWLAP